MTSLATLVKTVKENTSFSRPSVMCIIATDWVTDGCLQMMLNVQSDFQQKVLPEGN
jgi:hypothetical protein